ncbi:MAG: GGDEF domain-containing protein [Gemmatimonadaceae bacterium]|nr:GGDEF domain-containing protein [Gemmatimonadaceae bacterium]
MPGVRFSRLVPRVAALAFLAAPLHAQVALGANAPATSVQDTSAHAAFAQAAAAPGASASSDSVATLTRRLVALRRELEVERLARVEGEREVLEEQQGTQRAFLFAAAILAVFSGWSTYRRRVDRQRLTATLGATDPLTGAWNRRHVQEVIPSDASAAVRRHLSAPVGTVVRDADIVFLMVDIDHFRLINQRYGDEAGDRVLENVARQLKAVVRDSDLVVRWGGDAFLIAYRFTNRDGVSELAERIRHKIEALETEVRGGERLKITASIGFSAFPFSRSNPNGLGWEGAIAIADLAAYATKREGRNGWSTFRAAVGDGVDVSLRDVTLRDIDARVAEGTVVMESSRGAHEPAAL